MPAKKPAPKAKKAKVPAKKVEHARKAEPLKKAGTRATPAPAARAKSPASKPHAGAAKSHAPIAQARSAKGTAKPASSKPAATTKPVASPQKAAPQANPPVVPKPNTAKPAAKPAAAADQTQTSTPSATPTAPAAPSRPVAPEKPAVSAKATPAPRRAAPEEPADSSADGEEGDANEATSTNLLAGPRNVKPYIPKRGEQYMNKEQLDHFRQILNSWKRDLMQEVDRTVLHMKDEAANFPDPNDRATQESEFSLELRTRDRERKLIRKIEEAMKRIDDGTYGYCNETGEEIGIKRLEARPVATLCVEAQERRERREKQYGDRDDRYR
jgi:DnaK suppressor protein